MNTVKFVLEELFNDEWIPFQELVVTQPEGLRTAMYYWREYIFYHNFRIKRVR